VARQKAVDTIDVNLALDSCALCEEPQAPKHSFSRMLGLGFVPLTIRMGRARDAYRFLHSY
jgi:hypothetical protein